MIEEKLNATVLKFEPICLEEMDEIKLMNRIDTKYVTHVKDLYPLLEKIHEEYYIQEINDSRISNYKTLYYDTPKHDMFMAHHNGKKTREKIRVRTYLDSSESYFEIKNKNNKGRTDKKRIPIKNTEIHTSFLCTYSKYSLGELKEHLYNDFKRITLVNKLRTERLTIDFDISFKNPFTGIIRDLKDIIIIELKRDGLSASPIKSVLNEMRIQQAGISKYCIGCLLTDHSFKYNRFKTKLKYLDKLTNYKYGYAF